MAKFKGIMSCIVLLALFILPVASPEAVAAGQQEFMTVSGLSQDQALTDSTMEDIRGKGSLSGFGNGLTGMAIQVNQGSAAQSSTIDGITLSGPGTQIQPLPSHMTTTLQSLQRLFQSWRR